MTRYHDPYATQDIFGGRRGHARHANKPRPPEVPAEKGLVVETAPGLGEEFVGEIIGVERTYDGEFVRLEGRRGVTRIFKMRPGAFLLEGKPVTLVWPKPTPAATNQPEFSRSGSRKVRNVQAQVALPSRIWVEGIHDAAIVERVWGHDLRVEGVVVEHIGGLDNLPQWLNEFQPGPKRRVGVLADHLIEGTKETRATQQLGPHVLVTGHPYVDVWQAVKPSSVGIKSWPEIPRTEDWKTGICQRLGWGSPTDGWRRVYSSVNSYRDLEPHLIGAVERLVDFVTEPHMQQ